MGKNVINRTVHVQSCTNQTCYTLPMRGASCDWECLEHSQLESLLLLLGTHAVPFEESVHTYSQCHMCLSWWACEYLQVPFQLRTHFVPCGTFPTEIPTAGGDPEGGFGTPLILTPPHKNYNNHSNNKRDSILHKLLSVYGDHYEWQTG